jgi:regulator of cell morphogenesis and NO signaling
VPGSLVRSGRSDDDARMKSPAFDASTPVGQIAREHPWAVEIFERLDVEYSCRGGRPLRDAAMAAGWSAEELLHELRSAAQTAAEPEGPEPTLAAILETIITDHHRLEAARLNELARSLADAPQSVPLQRLRRLLDAVHATMRTHMLREERDLFPRLEELELHPERVRAGSVTNPLLIEFVEHETVHEWLTRMRELVLQLRLEGLDAGLLAALEMLHRQVHRHLHLENNVLIPRVIDLENRLRLLRHAGTQDVH